MHFDIPALSECDFLGRDLFLFFFREPTCGVQASQINLATLLPARCWRRPVLGFLSMRYRPFRHLLFRLCFLTIKDRGTSMK